MSEKINHPSHYQREGRKECIEEIREKYGDYITCIFCLTNAYKYLYRAGAKEGNSAESDIAKAKWYYDYQDKIDMPEPWSYLADNLLEDIEKELKKYENNQTKF